MMFLLLSDKPGTLQTRYSQSRIGGIIHTYVNVSGMAGFPLFDFFDQKYMCLM